MLIGIDGNEANVRQRVGVGQYAFNLLHALKKIDTQNSYIVYLKNPPLKDMPSSHNHWQYRVFGPSFLWTKLALPLHLYTQPETLNLFYSPSHYSPHFSPFPTIPTIHDLGYLYYPSQFKKKDLYQLTSWSQRSIQKASHIIAVSNFTKSEIIKTYHIPENKISIAYDGVDPPKTTNSDVLKRLNIKQPYFLFLGTLKPSKNIPFLIDAFSQFLKTSNSDIKLVIAGSKGWLFDEIFATVLAKKLQDKVIFTGYVSDTDRWTLYHHAAALLIPSLYEGFGIPAIEALITGTPVISSNIPPLKEILSTYALFADPHDAKAWVLAMKQILSSKSYDPKPAQNYVSKFSWENTARSVLHAFNQV